MTRHAEPRSPEARLARIAKEGLCIGCGLCQSVAGAERVRVVRTTTGDQRPVAVGPLDHATVDRIYDVCPGIRVEGLPAAEVDQATRVDPVWGPIRRVVLAWAADPEVRFRGATGGVLTALGQFLVRSGRVDFVLHVKASSDQPTFGERALSFTAAEVLEGAGSRYGPTPPLIDVREVLDRDRPLAFVGKPCDVAALRNWARHDRRVDRLVRYWLTPVCGGYMPPDGTLDFLARQGVAEHEVRAFRYRGHGCPGPTRIETTDGRVIERRYTDFWGEDYRAWTLPFRCKICPDGIGEAADLAAADTWPGGAPDPASEDLDPGTNGVIARTARGVELLDAAERAGFIRIGEEVGTAELDDWQPHQVWKKRVVWARLAGLRAAGSLGIDTARLRIAALARERSVRENLLQARGTRERVRSGRAGEPAPVPAS